MEGWFGVWIYTALQPRMACTLLWGSLQFSWLCLCKWLQHSHIKYKATLLLMEDHSCSNPLCVEYGQKSLPTYMALLLDLERTTGVTDRKTSPFRPDCSVLSLSCCSMQCKRALLAGIFNRRAKKPSFSGCQNCSSMASFIRLWIFVSNLSPFQKQEET